QVSSRRGTYLRDRIAANNFNYRTEALALNVVGSGVLDCGRAVRPAECYGDRNIPFELSHDGEVLLQNVDGEIHEFIAEPAAMRGARAIVAERVLTSPLSAPDRDLVTALSRTEFRGRPTEGWYVLRIPARPEIVWSRIEG